MEIGSLDNDRNNRDKDKDKNDKDKHRDKDVKNKLDTNPRDTKEG